ncbi:SURF1 family protein [Devosia sp.]|uniref:SURF1 family protein n=1 Tax=Devosia sp. TaxID=1871048 RepID=UPI002EDF7F1E
MPDSDRLPSPPARRFSLRTAAFVVLMLALTGVFAALGAWQWQRLAEKQALIAAVEERIHQPAIALPAAREWPALAPAYLDYRPLTASGRYVPEGTVLVFTSIAGGRGRYSGPGYWVMTPLALAEGGTLFVNRGFVPEAAAAAFAGGGPLPEGEVTVTGIGRMPEPASAFTPGADIEKRIEWVRDPERLARFAAPAPAPFAPVYLDLPAGDAGALPQGGETVVEFPNNHLGYAMTWFGFALLTPIMLGFWLLRRGRPAPDR